MNIESIDLRVAGDSGLTFEGAVTCKCFSAGLGLGSVGQGSSYFHCAVPFRQGMPVGGRGYCLPDSLARATCRPLRHDSTNSLLESGHSRRAAGAI